MQPRNGQTGGTLYPDVQPRRRGASDISQALGGGIFGRIAGAALGGALDMMQEQQAKVSILISFMIKQQAGQSLLQLEKS